MNVDITALMRPRGRGSRQLYSGPMGKKGISPLDVFKRTSMLPRSSTHILIFGMLKVRTRAYRNG